MERVPGSICEGTEVGGNYHLTLSRSLLKPSNALSTFTLFASPYILCTVATVIFPKLFCYFKEEKHYYLIWLTSLAHAFSSKLILFSFAFCPSHLSLHL